MCMCVRAVMGRENVFKSTEATRFGGRSERGRESTLDCRRGRCLNNDHRYLHVITSLTI